MHQDIVDLEQLYSRSQIAFTIPKALHFFTQITTHHTKMEGIQDHFANVWRLWLTEACSEPIVISPLSRNKMATHHFEFICGLHTVVERRHSVCYNSHRVKLKTVKHDKPHLKQMSNAKKQNHKYMIIKKNVLSLKREFLIDLGLMSWDIWIYTMSFIPASFNINICLPWQLIECNKPILTAKATTTKTGNWKT